MHKPSIYCLPPLLSSHAPACRACNRKLTQCSSGALAKVICIQSRSWQMTWQFSVQTEWKERQGGGGGMLPPQLLIWHANRKPEIVKCNSAINNRGKPSISVGIINSRQRQAESSGREEAGAETGVGRGRTVQKTSTATPCSSRRGFSAARLSSAWRGESHRITQSGASSPKSHLHANGWLVWCLCVCVGGRCQRKKRVQRKNTKPYPLGCILCGREWNQPQDL